MAIFRGSKCGYQRLAVSIIGLLVLPQAATFAQINMLPPGYIDSAPSDRPARSSAADAAARARLEELKQAERELSALQDDFKNAAITQEQIVAEAERNLTSAREYRHQFDCRLTPQHPTCDPIPPEADVLVAQARRLLSDAQSGSALKLRELAINAAKERVRRLRVRSIELHDY